MSNPQQLGWSDVVKAGILTAKTAGDYTAQTGQECPLYDQNKPVKTWWDPVAKAMDPMAPYPLQQLGFDASGNPAVLTVTIPAGFAAEPNVNVFGHFQSYAEWVQSRPATKSTVSWTGPFSGIPAKPVNASDLFTPAEADGMAAEISANVGRKFVATQQDTYGSAMNITYDPSDQRRVYQIIDTTAGPNSTGWDLEALWPQRCGSGVECPGTWAIDATRGPVFTPEMFPSMPSNTTQLLPPITVPAGYDPFSPFPGVVALRLVGSNPPVASGGGLEADERNAVLETYRLMTALAKAAEIS